MNLETRTLTSHEFASARDLIQRNPDFHTRRSLRRLPSYYRLLRRVAPDPVLWTSQRLVVGGFVKGRLISTVSVQQIQHEQNESQPDVDATQIARDFEHRELKRFEDELRSLMATHIGAPAGSYYIHSLAVEAEYRKRGVARRLLEFTLDTLDAQEKLILYIEFARLGWLHRFGESLGFKTAKQTLSIRERMKYGCWGSVLMQYQQAETHDRTAVG